MNIPAYINIGWYVHNYGTGSYGQAPDAVYWIGRTIGSGTEIPIVYDGNEGAAVSPETDLTAWKAAGNTSNHIWYLDHRGGSRHQQFSIPWSHTFIDQPNTTEQVTYHLRGSGFDWESSSGIQLGLYPNYSNEWTCEEKNLATNITTPQTQGQLGHGANWPVP